MDNPVLKQTTVIKIPDKNDDSSDLLSMLQVVELLYGVSRMVISNHSAAAILMSLAVEVQTLVIKLQVMRERWSVHLPFKEALKVDFHDWSKKIEHFASVISSSDCRYCLDSSLSGLSDHCLLDLYELATVTTGGNPDQTDLNDPKQLLQHHAAMTEALNAQREQSIALISQLIDGQLTDRQGLCVTQLRDLDKVRTFCSGLLSELAGELFKVYEQQVKIFNPIDYERLADRILFEPEYEGHTARREARDIMHNWRNGVPAGKLEESRKAQIEQTKEEIRRTRHGVKLEQYVNLDADFYSQRSEFGRFLFHRRRDITRAELYELIRLVYCVYYYQKDADVDPTGESGVPDANSSEQFSDLPTEFEQKLRDRKGATMRFYRILLRVEPYINKSGATVPGSIPELCDRYKGWGWYHLKTAFEKLGFLPNNSSSAAFARFIHVLFPHRTETSVQRSLYRNNNVNSPKIVADVIKEFNEVWK